MKQFTSFSGHSPLLHFPKKSFLPAGRSCSAKTPYRSSWVLDVGSPIPILRRRTLLSLPSPAWMRLIRASRSPLLMLCRFLIVTGKLRSADGTELLCWAWGFASFLHRATAPEVCEAENSSLASLSVPSPEMLLQFDGFLRRASVPHTFSEPSGIGEILRGSKLALRFRFRIGLGGRLPHGNKPQLVDSSLAKSIPGTSARSFRRCA